LWVFDTWVEIWKTGIIAWSAYTMASSMTPSEQLDFSHDSSGLYTQARILTSDVPKCHFYYILLVK
jgi:hypothetical protein